MMTEIQYFTVIYFLRGITQEHGPYQTRDEAIAKGETERDHHRHKPIYYKVEERFVYKYE